MSTQCTPQVQRPAVQLTAAPFTYHISPQPGHYLVTEMGQAGVRSYRVGKDKSCTCGACGDGNGHGPTCRHVRAVRQYLEDGGSRAPETATGEGIEPRLQQRMDCPVCGAPVLRKRPYRNQYTGRLQEQWACPEDPAHYWHWRRSAAQARAANPTPEMDADREERRRRIFEMYRRSGASDEKIERFLNEPWSERVAFQEAAQAMLVRLTM